jgi:hypothetical protein
VVWIGQVDEIMSMGDYQAHYPKRRDAIYRRIGYEPDGRERLEHTGALQHREEPHWSSDAKGRNALIFRRFWYWRAEAPRAESLAYLAHHYIGQTSKQVRMDDLARLEAWLARPGSPEPVLRSPYQARR